MALEPVPGLQLRCHQLNKTAERTVQADHGSLLDILEHQYEMSSRQSARTVRRKTKLILACFRASDTESLRDTGTQARAFCNGLACLHGVMLKVGYFSADKCKGSAVLLPHTCADFRLAPRSASSYVSPCVLHHFELRKGSIDVRVFILASEEAVLGGNQESVACLWCHRKPVMKECGLDHSLSLLHQRVVTADGEAAVGEDMGALRLDAPEVPEDTEPAAASSNPPFSHVVLRYPRQLGLRKFGCRALHAPIRLIHTRRPTTYFW